MESSRLRSFIAEDNDRSRAEGGASPWSTLTEGWLVGASSLPFLPRSLGPLGPLGPEYVPLGLKENQDLPSRFPTTRPNPGPVEWGAIALEGLIEL